MNKILLVGVARSGTTWVATILSKCKDTYFFNEPDDERRFTEAAKSKRGITRYPTIAPGDSGRVGESDIAAYADLWRRAWQPFQVENLLIKSVFAPFCLEWLKERFEIDHVVWVQRDIYSVIRSWYEYSRQANPGVDEEVLLRRLSWQAASHVAAYARLDRFDFFSYRAVHEAFVHDPKREFELLAKALGMETGHEAWEQLDDLNQSGVGGHYGLPGYDAEEHVRRTKEEATADPNWNNAERVIIDREVGLWLPS